MFNIKIESLKGKTLETIKGLTFGQAMNELANQLDGASSVSEKTSLAELCLQISKYGTPDFYVTLGSDSNAAAMNKALANSDKPFNL